LARRFSKPDSGRSARTERRAAQAKSEAHAGDPHAFLPTREEVLKYIEENPDRAGKRELAKAFNIKGDARVYLKDLLRELADDGLVEKRARKLSRPGSLPSVAVLDVTGRDDDGRWCWCAAYGSTRHRKVARQSVSVTAFWQRFSATKTATARSILPA